MAVLLVCGHGWLVGGLARHLEWRYLPPNPVPQADCILVLSGGIMGRIPHRPAVEIAEAGDRVLYGAHLYRQGKAPRIICAGNVATAGLGVRPAAEDMAELLEEFGIPKDSIVTETHSEDTHQHARNYRNYSRVGARTFLSAKRGRSPEADKNVRAPLRRRVSRRPEQLRIIRLC